MRAFTKTLDIHNF